MSRLYYSDDERIKNFRIVPSNCFWKAGQFVVVSDETEKDKSDYSFDYENQVWIKGGRYQDCGHPKHMNCKCFGRLHKDEKAIITKDCY